MKIPKDFVWTFSPHIQPVRDFKMDDWFVPTEGVDQKYAERKLLSMHGTWRRIVSAAVVLFITAFMIAGLVAMHK